MYNSMLYQNVCYLYVFSVMYVYAYERKGKKTQEKLVLLSIMII